MHNFDSVSHNVCTHVVHKNFGEAGAVPLGMMGAWLTNYQHVSPPTVTMLNFAIIGQTIRA